MSAYQPYPKYKPSGLAWLGDVPDGWRTVPVFANFRRVKETNHPDLQLLSVYRDYGVIPKASRDDNFNKASDDLGAYQRIQQGDLVLNKMKAWQGSIGISSHEGIVSPAYFTYRPTKVSTVFDPDYLHHLVRSLEYIAFYLSRSKGIRVNQWDLDPDEFRTTPLICPPLPEQRQIAAFLDRECGKLDALQAKQERLIELLKEKRQALISHAVTRGLDPAAKLKPSGIEWLGDVPEHWVCLSLSRVIQKIEQGWSPNATDFPPTLDQDGVIKLSAIKGGAFIEHECKTLDEGSDITGQPVIRVGDFLVTRANTLQLVADSCVVKNLSHPRLILSDLVYRLRFERNRMHADFINYVFRSPLVRSQIETDARGSSMTMAKISQAHIKSWKIPLPPLAEQRAIVAHLDAKCGKLDLLKAKAERAIELLKERRSALISAAVTGKIDVRDVAADCIRQAQPSKRHGG